MAIGKSPLTHQVSHHITIETALLQLDFPAFLREGQRPAAKRHNAILRRVSTNAIALTNFGASANLKRPGGIPGLERTLYMAIHLVDTQHTCMAQQKPVNTSAP